MTVPIPYTDASGVARTIAAEQIGSNIAFDSVPNINGAPVSASNPMPVSDAAAEASLGSLSSIATEIAAASATTGATVDAAWAGSGSATMVAALKGIFGQVAGTGAGLTTLCADWTTGIGGQGTGASFNPPIGGSGVLGYLSGIWKAVSGLLTFQLVDGGGINKATISASGALRVDGSAVTQPVSGTGNFATIDAADGPVTPGIAAGASTLIGGIYSATAPSLANGQQAAAQFDAAGNLKVNVVAGGGGGGGGNVTLTGVGAGSIALGSTTSSASLPVVVASDQAAIAVKQSVAGNLLATVTTNADAAIAAGTAPSKALVGGLIYNSSAPVPTNGQSVALQGDASGNLKVNLATALPAGAAVIGAVTQSGSWTVGLSAGANTIGIVTVIPTASATTNLSSTIATGGSFQSIATASTSRRGLTVKNPLAATETLYVNFGATASATIANSIDLAPGDSASFTDGSIPSDIINVMGATTGHAFYADIR